MDSGHVARWLSSCRDNTITQTAPMHTTRSPHSGPSQRRGLQGRNRSGLLGQPLCLYCQRPAADGFALCLEIQVTDGQ